MKMDEHARAWSHEYVAGLLAATAVPSEQRNSFHWEILNHLHEAAEAKAQARDGTVITLVDAQEAAHGLGGREGLSDHFQLGHRVAATPRAGFPKRLVAFLIDVVLVLPIVSFVFTVVGTFLDAVIPWNAYTVRDLAYLLLTGTMFALAYAYLVVMEVRFGATVGKMVFRLRAVRADGGTLTVREALIRNVAKAIPPLLVLDVLLYLIAFSRDDQRASDRIANTIVIDSSRAAWEPAPAAPPAFGAPTHRGHEGHMAPPPAHAELDEKR